ncbi:MAG: hypothetical protein ONB42_13355 [candidate division KSB1 bacterium]|nr:hypothetical protein [candidate division KSB1 bacterium]
MILFRRSDFGHNETMKLMPSKTISMIICASYSLTANSFLKKTNPLTREVDFWLRKTPAGYFFLSSVPIVDCEVPKNNFLLKKEVKVLKYKNSNLKKQ